MMNPLRETMAMARSHLRAVPGTTARAAAVAAAAVLVTACASSGGSTEAEQAAAPARALADSIQGRGGVSSGSAPAEGLPRPVGNGDYLIGPGDLIQVRVFGAEDLGGELRVTSGGEVSMPLLGAIAATGLTSGEMETVIAEGLAEKYMRDPSVSVQVLEVRIESVYVVGEVARPGGFPLSRNESISVLQAVALSGGLGPTAAKAGTLIYRTGDDGERQEIPVDLDRVLDGSVEDPLLRPRDVLFVPNSRARSFARGALDAFVRMFTLRGLLY